MKTFSAAEKAALRAAHVGGRPLDCPTCAVPLDQTSVPPNPFVSYVRHRTTVTCPSCHGHLVLDRSDHDPERR